MAPILGIIQAHLSNLASDLIPYIVEEYARETQPATLLAAHPKLTKLADIARHHFVLLAGDISPHQARAFRRAGLQQFRKFRVSADAFHLVDTRALHFARERGAELVKDVSDSTREMVRDKVSQALEQKWSVQQLTDELRTSDIFSPTRSLRISRTELQLSWRAGAREGALTAGANQMRWDAGADACELCEANVEAGWIDAGSEFPEGDAPHPNCRCSVEYRIQKEEDQEPEE